MNITMIDIVLAHGERIAEACSRAHEALTQMDPDTPVRNVDERLVQLHGDRAVVIPLRLDAPDGGKPGTNGEMLDGIADRLAEIEGDLLALREGGRSVDNEWTAQAAWLLERLARNEDNPVTIGVNPLSRRLLALYQAERIRQGVYEDVLEITPRCDWADALPAIEDELALVQEFVAQVVPHMGSDSSDDFKAKMTTQISLREVMVGHPTGMTIEFLAGQVACVATILTRMGPGSNDWDSVYIDDNTIVIDQVVPQALAQMLVGQPLEQIFDHFLTNGLGLLIEQIETGPKDTTITLKRQQAQPLTLTDAPENWWDID